MRQWRIRKGIELAVRLTLICFLAWGYTDSHGAWKVVYAVGIVVAVWAIEDTWRDFWDGPDDASDDDA